MRSQLVLLLLFSSLGFSSKVLTTYNGRVKFVIHYFFRLSKCFSRIRYEVHIRFCKRTEYLIIILTNDMILFLAKLIVAPVLYQDQIMMTEVEQQQPVPHRWDWGLPLVVTGLSYRIILERSDVKRTRTVLIVWSGGTTMRIFAQFRGTFTLSVWITGNCNSNP